MGSWAWGAGLLRLGKPTGGMLGEPSAPWSFAQSLRSRAGTLKGTPGQGTMTFLWDSKMFVLIGLILASLGLLYQNHSLPIITTISELSRRADCLRHMRSYWPLATLLSFNLTTPTMTITVQLTAPVKSPPMNEAAFGYIHNQSNDRLGVMVAARN